MHVVYGRTTGYLVELKYRILFHNGITVVGLYQLLLSIESSCYVEIVYFSLISLSVASDNTINFDKNNQDVFVKTEKYI